MSRMPHLTESEFRRLYSMVKRKHAKVFFYFRDFKYLLSIDGLIRARDKNFDIVRWASVFSSKAPYEILNSLDLEKVEVELKGSVEPLIFNSLEEFVSWLERD